MKQDGSSHKGMARGSNASEGLWMSSPEDTRLQDTRRVFLFESAYNAMAFYQLLMGKDSNLDDRRTRRNLLMESLLRQVATHLPDNSRTDTYSQGCNLSSWFRHGRSRTKVCRAVQGFGRQGRSFERPYCSRGTI